MLLHFGRKAVRFVGGILPTASQPGSLVGSSVHITKTVSLGVRYQARRPKPPFHRQADGVSQGLLAAGALGPNESTAALISASAIGRSALR